MIPRQRIAATLALLVVALTASAAEEACPALRRIADGVWLRPAESGAPGPDNGGRVAHAVIFVGTAGTVVLDPGPSRRAGRALRCAVDRLGAPPVVALLDSDARPERVLANGAFEGVPILATPGTIERMARRCADCLSRLAALVGDAALDGTVAVIPDRPVGAETRLDLGERALRLLPFDTGLVVIDPREGLAFAGQLADADDLPDFSDGTLQGAIAALTALVDTPGLATVVPSRGAPFPIDGLRERLAYLHALARVATAEIDAGNIAPPAELPAALQRWPGDGRRHALNLQQAMREAEAAWWARLGAAR